MLGDRSAPSGRAITTAWLVALALTVSLLAPAPVAAVTNPTVSIQGTSADEGDAGTTTFTFQVTLSGPTSDTVTVDWETVLDGTATRDDDLAHQSGTLTIAPLATSGTIDVEVDGDDVDEPDETFTVALTSATNATVSSSQGSATGTIVNDDAPSVTIDDTSAGEADGTLDFDLRLSNASHEELRIQVVTPAPPEDTATPDVDYTPIDTDVVVAAGTTTATVSVPTVADDMDEADETVTVRLAIDADQDATLADDTAVGTIVDDDPDAPPVITVSDVTVVEGDSGTTIATFPVDLNKPGESDLTVDYATADGTATASDGDYTPTSGTLTIPAGARTSSIEVDVGPDTVAEHHETLNLLLGSPTGATLGRDLAIGTIRNDDGPRLSVSGPASVTEGAPGQTRTVAFTVSLTDPATADHDVSVDYTTVDGTATADGGDYQATAGTLTIPAGVSDGTVEVPVLGDDVDEPDEDLSLELSEPVMARLGTATADATITDDDDPPAISIGDVSVIEGDSGASEVVVDVTLSNPSSQEVQVTWATGDGTATAADGDYEAVPPTELTVAPLQTQATVTVTVHGDTTEEPNEALVVDLSDPVNATVADGMAQVTIVNDDGAYLTIDDVAVHEGPSGTTTVAAFPVHLSEPAGDTVTVGWATADGTASAETPDYQAGSGTLEIAAGDTGGTIEVTVVGDDLPGPDETFTVELSDAAGASILDDAAVGTIVNDDGPSLSVADVTVLEGDAGTTAEAVLTVTLSGTVGADVTVDYATSAGTAGPDDHTATSGTLTIPQGSTSGQISLTVAGDDVPEPSETFTVTLSDASYAVIADGVAIVTIENDDGPTLTASAEPVAEGDTGPTDLPVTLALSQPAPDPVTVDYTTADGSATTSDGDYQAASGTATIPAGDTHVALTVEVSGDTRDEPDEDLHLLLSAPGHASLATRDLTLTVRDDDEPASTGDTGDGTDAGGTTTGDDTGDVERLGGTDRIATAVAASRRHWDSAPDALLATAWRFPDALAAGPYAAALDAPLLLSDADAVPDAVADELRRLDVQRVWLAGGTAVISQAVEDQLRRDGYEVHRLAGADRFGTARQIALRTGLGPSGEVVVALGTHAEETRAWPDALSAGALAATADRPPVLLTAADQLPPATRDALARLSPARVLLLGGSAAVSPAVEQELADLDYPVRRLAGASRYGTSAAVAAEALSRHPDGPVPVVFATGANYPDGLAAGALAARLDALVLLVPPDDLTAAAEVGDLLRRHADRFDAGTVVGGPSAVTDRVLQQLSDAMAAPR